MDVCRHCCSEGSYRELGASFPGPHLQPPESEANKGVHPEEGGRAPKDRLHPFPPQPALPRGLLALQPLDLLGAEEARAAVRRDPQTACGCTQLHTHAADCTRHAAGLQSLCGAGHSSLSLTQTSCHHLPGSASKTSWLWLLWHSGLWMGPTLCSSFYSVFRQHLPQACKSGRAFMFLRPTEF